MIKKYSYININDSYDMKGKDIIIWGLSVSGLNAYIRFIGKGANVIGFTDSFVKKTDELFASCRIFSFDELNKMDRPCIYISTLNEKYLFEIFDKIEQLENPEILCSRNIYGPGLFDTVKMHALIEKDAEEIRLIKKSLTDAQSVKVFENLIEYRKTNDRIFLEGVVEKAHPQYFPTDGIITLREDEIFVDAGAYNGDTSVTFSKNVKGQYKHIYLMEPNKFLFDVTCEYLKLNKLHDYTVINKGAYSKTATLHFDTSSFADGSSTLDDDGKEIVETISIDEMLAGKKATFIKMDIEGAERDALEGCRKTIIMYRPKLAISIYHLEDDLWKIPYWVIKNFPFYKMYIRHYTRTTNETVLYAIPDESI